MNTAAGVAITVNASGKLAASLASLGVTSDVFAGVQGAIAHAVFAKSNLDEERSTPGSTSTNGGKLLVAASQGEVLSAQATDPAAFAATIAGFADGFAAAVAEIAAMKPVNEARWAYSLALLQSAFT